MSHRASTTPQRQLVLARATLKHARDVLGFLQSNPTAGTPAARARVRRNHAWLLRLGLRARAEALGRIQAASLPLHHALWECLLRYEGGYWSNPNTGGNGHWGGLQMHPDWGYGTSHHASDDSQYVQESAAERAYRESGYSSTFLTGQWGETIGHCWAYR